MRTKALVGQCGQLSVDEIVALLCKNGNMPIELAFDSRDAWYLFSAQDQCDPEVSRILTAYNIVRDRVRQEVERG